MTIELNHLIVLARDKHESAGFLAEVLGLASPRTMGPFVAVEVANGVTLDYADSDTDFPGQHYAFLVSEAEFDASFNRLRERGLPFSADPHGQQPGQINTRDGGRGVYFDDPSGHRLEIITRPYGG